MSTAKSFQGVLFDILDETIIERAPVVRSTYERAMADALAMVDEDPRYCQADAYVLADGILVYSAEEAAA